MTEGHKGTRRGWLSALCLVCGLAIASACRANDVITVQILASADIHGRFVPFDYAANEPVETGSMAQLASLVYALRAEHISNTLLLDNGDFSQGNFQHLFVSQTNPVLLAMNEMGYDAVNLGNHEFNAGVPALQSLMEQFHDPGRVLCGNVYAADGKRLFALSTVVTTDQGVAVGLIGTVSPHVARWDAAHLGDFTVTSPVKETRQAADELRDRVDILVALTHMGRENQYDTPHSGYRDLAEAVPELDLIIGAHSHELVQQFYYDGTFYDKEDASPAIRRHAIACVQPGRWAEALSQVLITVTREKDRFVIAHRATDIAITNLLVKTEERMIPPDPKLMRLLLPFHDKTVAYGRRVLGQLEGGPLVPESAWPEFPVARTQPTALVGLINAVQMHYGKQMAGGRAIDVSATPAFSTDANIQPGEIRYGDTARIYPFDNEIYVLEMTGEQLVRYMEWCARYFRTFEPGDLTLSFDPAFRGYNFDMFAGLRYEMDVSRPPGQRIQNLARLDGQPVQDRDSLLVAVNNHRAQAHLLTSGVVYEHADEAPVLLAGSGDGSIEHGRHIRDLIVHYIETVNEGIISNTYADAWQIVGAEWDPALRGAALEAVTNGLIAIRDTAPEADPRATPYATPVTVRQLEKHGLLPRTTPEDRD